MSWTAGVVCRYHRAARFELVAPRGGAPGASDAAGAMPPPVPLLKGGAARAEHQAEGEVCDATATPTARTAEVFVPVIRIAQLVLVLYFGTLFYCLYLYVAEGRAPKHGALPYISDTFVYPPGDWISRWALPLGSSCCLFAHGCLYYMDGGTNLLAPSTGIVNLLDGEVHLMDGRTNINGRVPLTSRAAAPAPSSYWYVLANVAMLGLCVVGCVNETEDWHLHSTGAMVYFIGYDAYMIGRTAILARMSVRRPISIGVQAACAATSAATTIARYGPRLYLAASGLPLTPDSTPVLDTVWPFLEWLDALAIAGYFGVSVLSHGATARATGLRIRCGRAVPACSEVRSP